MKSFACMSAGSLLSKRASGLSAAERLRLEAHLQECAACRADAHALSALFALARAPTQPSLSKRARERAIVAALRHAATPPGHAEIVAAHSWRSRLAWPATAALAAAAAILIVALVAGDRGGETARGDSAESARDAALVLAGDVSADEQPLEIGAQIEPGVELTTNTGARLALGRASVELRASSAIVWDPDEQAVSLRAGKVHAKVAPGPERTFRVRTSTFTAEVVGTEFEVTRHRVKVFEGTVRIVSPDGADVLVAALTDGEEWHAAVATASPRKKRARKRPRRRAGSKAAPVVELEVPEGNPAAWLASARTHIAKDDVAEAKQYLAQVLDWSANRRERAEAYSLIAECALVAGEKAKAARLYLKVADNYRGLPAAENALFAAARIKANAGPAAEARDLLERYLERYPSGRFRAEAERRLQELE